MRLSPAVVLPALAVVLAALVLYPFVGTGYGVRAMLQIFMWIALAGSWNLISGLTGYVSFGHVAFFGAGAYTGAILVASAGWSWPVAALAGGIAAAPSTGPHTVPLPPKSTITIIVTVMASGNTLSGSM